MRAHWRLYDQSGVKSKQDVKSMKRRGGLLPHKVLRRSARYQSHPFGVTDNNVIFAYSVYAKI